MMTGLNLNSPTRRMVLELDCLSSGVSPLASHPHFFWWFFCSNSQFSISFVEPLVGRVIHDFLDFVQDVLLDGLLVHLVLKNAQDWDSHVQADPWQHPIANAPEYYLASSAKPKKISQEVFVSSIHAQGDHLFVLYVGLLQSDRLISGSRIAIPIWIEDEFLGLEGHQSGLIPNSVH